VLDVDTEKERISLGIKQLEDDPFEAAAGEVRKGQVVTCTVTDVQDNAIEVRVGDEDGPTGTIRKAELARDRSEQRPDRYAPGEKVDAKVTSVDKKNRRITLSIKQREIDEEKEAMAEYGSTDTGASLGEILGPAMRSAVKEAASEEDDSAAGSKSGAKSGSSKKSSASKSKSDAGDEES
jgi:small subunit ribosomal protein S1